MNRSGKLLATHDDLILELISSPLYDVRPDGTVWTLVTKQGHVSKSGTWREAGGIGLRNFKPYRRLKFKRIHLAIHRIVCAKFVGALSDDLVVNHKDGDGLNNHPSNLELVSQSENNIHRFRVLNFPAVKGFKKIDFQTAEQIRSDKEQGLSHRELALKYDLSKTSISYIVNGRTWKAA